MANDLEESLGEGAKSPSIGRFLKHMVPVFGDIEFWDRLQSPEVSGTRRIHTQDRAAYFFASTSLKYATFAFAYYVLANTFSR